VKVADSQVLQRDGKVTLKCDGLRRKNVSVGQLDVAGTAVGGCADRHRKNQISLCLSEKFSASMRSCASQIEYCSYDPRGFTIRIGFQIRST
jgi:hypothetical protein